MFYLGIDQHRKQLTINLRNRRRCFARWTTIDLPQRTRRNAEEEY
jgi:hypothetical protein